MRTTFDNVAEVQVGAQITQVRAPLETLLLTVPHVSRVLLRALAFALLAMPVAAQRPALTGEKAQVAEAVKADLTRLSELQTAHHNRTRVYAADARDLGFTPTSGATINIAYASMNAWAANATHPTLSPVSCFIIFSSAEPTGPAAQPFCQEGRPGAPGTVPQQPAAGATTPPQTATPAPQTQQQAPSAAPANAPLANPPAVTTTPSQPARQVQQPTPQTQAPAQSRSTTQTGAPRSNIPAAALAGTRDIDVAGITVPSQTENVTPAVFSQRLRDFAQGAATMYAEIQSRNESIVRDPYESTAEYEARRAAAFEATQRREREFFQQNSKTYVVAMPVKDVSYDPDREVFEFTVDGIGLPVSRDNGAGSLTLTCYSRPVFWCSGDSGMIYEAGDLWRIPRATARQHDILRTPLTLNAHFAVGRRNDAPVLAVSLLSMDLQARGQSVSRWDGASR